MPRFFALLAVSFCYPITEGQIRLVSIGGPIDVAELDSGPVTLLVIEPEERQLLRQIRRELLVLRAASLPVVDRADLVEELRALH